MGYRAKKLVIFDLDGTLVDTIDDVCICFNRSLIECGYPARSLAYVSSLIGLPLEEIVASLLPDNAPKNDVARVSQVYKKVYAKSDKPNTHPFPGVVDVLNALNSRGIHLAVNTNKAHEIALDVVNAMFSGLEMPVFGYGKAGTTKPSPEAVFALMEMYGVASNEMVYVGDTIVDVETACNAGIDSIVVSWGQGDSSLYEDKRITSVVNDPQELLSAITQRED